MHYSRKSSLKIDLHILITVYLAVFRVERLLFQVHLAVERPSYHRHYQNSRIAISSFMLGAVNEETK